MVKKILVIGPAWVGDMIMSQSLFMALKKKYPDCIIDVLAPDWTRALLTRMPEVNQSISLPIGHKQLLLKKRYQLGKALRQENYEQAIILPNSFKSALIPWFAKIPKRTGWSREGRSLILTDARRLNKQQFPLMIERFLALAFTKKSSLPKPYPIPKLTIDPNALQKTIEKFNLVVEKKILALCPGAEFGPAKQWPYEYYASIANALLNKDWQVWLFGSKNDETVAREIQRLCNHQCMNLTGQTSLAEAIDLLSLATQVVTNDSGLMHVAAALSRPLVAIYGPTSPKFTPPLGNQVDIVQLNLPCQPCFQRTCPLKHHHCMRQLSINSVLEKLGPL